MLNVWACVVLAGASVAVRIGCALTRNARYVDGTADRVVVVRGLGAMTRGCAGLFGGRSAHPIRGTPCVLSDGPVAIAMGAGPL
ncbi:MAG: hypothetical protein ACP5VE_01320 [Chthonomonadales bacterium]